MRININGIGDFEESEEFVPKTEKIKKKVNPPMKEKDEPGKRKKVNKHKKGNGDVLF